jgi:hypothetical protein
LPKKKKVLKSLLESKPVTNIWKSLITTSLGVVIILGSLFSSIVMNNSWSDSVWGIAVGLGLLFAPDEILKKLKNFIR